VVPAISSDEDVLFIHVEETLAPVILFVVFTVPWLVTVTLLAMLMTGEIERFVLLGIFLSPVILIVPVPVILPVVILGVIVPPEMLVPTPLSVNVFVPMARVPLFIRLPDKVTLLPKVTVVPEPMVKSPVKDGKVVILEEPVPVVVTSTNAGFDKVKKPVPLVFNEFVTDSTPVLVVKLPPA
jgi:hypothetical protein